MKFKKNKPYPWITLRSTSQVSNHTSNEQYRKSWNVVILIAVLNKNFDNNLNRSNYFAYTIFFHGPFSTQKLTARNIHYVWIMRHCLALKIKFSITATNIRDE